MTKTTRTAVVLLFASVLAPAIHAQDKPNIVLIFMDNFGYGELGCYGGGITRGGPTPRIDRLATEGIRLSGLKPTPGSRPPPHPLPLRC